MRGEIEANELVNMGKLREDANQCKRSTRLGTEELRLRGDRHPGVLGIPHQGNCSDGVVHSSLSQPRALNRCRMSFRKKAGFAPPAISLESHA